MSLAIDTITNNIHLLLSDKYKAVSVINNFRSGIHTERAVEITPSNSYKGILFDLNSERSYLDLYISEINFFSEYTGDVELKFIDLITGQILATKTISAVANEIITILPNISFASKKRRLKLFVGYDTTGITSYKTVLRNSSSGNLFIRGTI